MTSRLLIFVLALAFAAPCLPQSFPSRPVRIVVPTSPGGATDSFSRAIAQRLAEGWGQPVVVENRPGANQIIGADHVAK